MVCTVERHVQGAKLAQPSIVSEVKEIADMLQKCRSAKTWSRCIVDTETVLATKPNLTDRKRSRTRNRRRQMLWIRIRMPGCGTRSSRMNAPRSQEHTCDV
eukprot:2580101-Pyramimonas_sp.AAC.1